MTCCSSGKARVYYNIPTKGGLKYKLKNSTNWKTILADESLTDSCEIQTEDAYYTVHITGINIENSLVVPFSTAIRNIRGPILNIYMGSTLLYEFVLFVETPYQQHGAAINNYRANETDGVTYTNLSTEWTVERLTQGNDPKKFTITGTETGTKYLEIEVDECPAVQTIPCKFDPAKEQHIDVEMIPYTELPVNLPNYPLFQDCIEITSVGNLVVIEKVTTRNYGPKADDDPSVRETRKIIKSLESPKGCPPPKVRVECCPKGICGEDKKCPKGTTCEIVCNGFKCCYRNNKLIRSIKL